MQADAHFRNEDRYRVSLGIRIRNCRDPDALEAVAEAGEARTGDKGLRSLIALFHLHGRRIRLPDVRDEGRIAGLLRCDELLFFRFGRRYRRRDRVGQGAEARGVARLHGVGVGPARGRRRVRVAGPARPRILLDDDKGIGVRAAQDLVAGDRVVRRVQPRQHDVALGGHRGAHNVGRRGRGGNVRRLAHHPGPHLLRPRPAPGLVLVCPVVIPGPHLYLELGPCDSPLRVSEVAEPAGYSLPRSVSLSSFQEG